MKAVGNLTSSTGSPTSGDKTGSAAGAWITWRDHFVWTCPICRRSPDCCLLRYIMMDPIISPGDASSHRVRSNTQAVHSPRQPKLQYPRKRDDEQLKPGSEIHMNVDRRMGEEIPDAKELPPQTSCSPQRSHHGTTPGTVARK